MTFRVLILGASGTGTTTLGRALGNDLSFRVFDTDDYYWLPSTPPFQRKQRPRPHEVCPISSPFAMERV